MRVDDIERVVVEVERVRVTDAELDVRDALAAGEPSRTLDHFARRVDADDRAGTHPPGEVDRDRAGPAADVEHLGTLAQMGYEVRGGIVDGTPRVDAQDALVVAVRVGVARGDFGLFDVHDPSLGSSALV